MTAAGRSSEAVTIPVVLAVVALAVADAAFQTPSSFWALQLLPVAFAAVTGRRIPTFIGAAAVFTFWLVVWVLVTPSTPLGFRVPELFLRSIALLGMVWIILYHIRPLLGHDAPVEQASEFEDHVQMELTRARRFDRPFTVAYLGIANADEVKKKLGQAGLNELVARLNRSAREHLRAVDGVHRVKGIEMALLLPETDEAGADVVLERVVEDVRERSAGEAPDLRFSIGAVTYWAGSRRPVFELLDRTHKLMARAQSKGTTISHEVMRD